MCIISQVKSHGCSNYVPFTSILSASFTPLADFTFRYVVCVGRIWAGHNIMKFDCPRIREAFAGVNRPAPEPKGIIDTLALLTERFGRRAGNMKVLPLYFMKN